MIRLFYISSIIFSFLTSASFAQISSLKQKLVQIISTKKADIGVSICGLTSKDTLNINGEKHFPMQSVFKFHIALAVLHQVDNGKLSLNQKIYIKKSDLPAGTWSPLQKRFPNGNIQLPLKEILSYTVSYSDNNGCDILLKLIGGTAAVNNYIHSMGIKDVSIQANEEEMRKAWDVQFANWSTPLSAVQLLRKFYNREILSKKSYNYLWKLMVESSRGNNRIKGQLPPGTVVAHKPGTSGTNEQDITAAVNDIGIVVLPNKEHFAISVFISNSKENDEVNEKIISDIAKLTWYYFFHKK